ncbi:fungal-specific transcription factor domain-containing protein [Ephemerocybe angulata]|uniref:Fungal-specific transcription factor domain-containing protein n=1 Tax=Ephemerocybe angulata TaxID=980116 RepID=A0A8H6ILK9_9AGAR|nr:fungal-specific transcription factor domain-containing protein [Tulosesus angulatus]
MEQRESDGSDAEPQHADDVQSMSRKRSSRACDQCRKTKSKCERPTGDGKKCKSCALAGTPCTFLGPSYKRGPPKGYIHAIEQRWHQVESLLGAILQCPDPHVKTIVSDLKQDDLAREILDRVDMGPYGPSGRRLQSVGSTREDFFASVLKSNEMSNSRDPSRALRQSRVSREIVSSSQDHGLSVVPTKEWQDNLSQRLMSFSSASHAPQPSSSSYGNLEFDSQYGHAAQKRRLNAQASSSTNGPPDWSNMYTMDPTTDDDEDFREATTEMGQLSLDEHQEVRYHGKSSGLHLLGRSQRQDDRIEGGVWRLPMARVWPASKFGLPSAVPDDSHVHLPPREEQDVLIDIYFTYVHPTFPIIYKSRFLSEYKERGGSTAGSPSASSTYSSSNATPRPEPTQEVTPLLLLSMFAVAARFKDDEEADTSNGKMWEGGASYSEAARKILSTVRNSRPSVVQAIVLLGYAEFGIGSMEQGWLLIGMGIRMAYDLGLNCDSSKWKIHDRDLFSPEESQTRRQIWWACFLADKYGSFYMGRPIMIKDGDYDTPLPDIDPVEDRQPWQPFHAIDNTPYHPVPGRVMSSFCAACRLSVIMGAIIAKVYPVQPPVGESRQTITADLESRLDQWYITLPEHLRYESAGRRATPPPQVLFLHIRYWGAVLLLHRALIPNWKRMDDAVRKSTVGYRAFDLARAAASHMSTIVTVYRETFSLRRASPFMTSYLLSAGIMHTLTMNLLPDSVDASFGLKQCLAALKDMELAWPSAARAWELLNGVHLGNSVSSSSYWEYPQQDRSKRQAHDAFEDEKNSNYLQTENYPALHDQQNGMSSENGVQDLSTRIMAHMLGLEMPGVEPSTSYFPGYEWWPRTNQGYPQPPPQGPVHSGPYSSQGDHDSMLGPVVDPSTMVSSDLDWIQTTSPTGQNPNSINNLNLNYPYDFQQYGP